MFVRRHLVTSLSNSSCLCCKWCPRCALPCLAYTHLPTHQKPIRANFSSCCFVKANALHNSSQHWTTAWEFPRYVWPGGSSSPSLVLPTMHHGTSVFSGPNVSTVLRGNLIFHSSNLHKICVIWQKFGHHTMYIALYHSVVWLDVMGQESQTVLDVVLLSYNWS